MLAVAIALGYAAGLAVAILTVGAEHSRIAFGSYALYGNGALIVPAILAPFALYPGWLWALRIAGDRRLEAALYTVGLHLGVGMVSVLDAVFFPQQPDVTLVDALPGLLLSGAIFVLPAALLAAATLWLIGSGRSPIDPITVTVAVLLAAALSFFLGAGLGILSGGAIALARQRPARSVMIGAALLPILVIVGNAPLAIAIFTTQPR